MRCDNCKTTLSAKNIGYVKSLRGHKEFECKRCHSHRKRGKDKRLSGSWMMLS